MQLTGHSLSHAPHEMHASVIVYAIGVTPHIGGFEFVRLVYHEIKLMSIVLEHAVRV